MANETHAKPLEILARAPLFGGLPVAGLQAALDASYYRRVEANAYFFHQGEPATTFYILLEGRLRLSQLTPEGHQVIIRILGPGEAMGIIVALSETNYPLSAEAITDCLALAWEGPSVIRLMERYPQLAINGLQMVAQRFVELQNRYRELATERVERRVARTLLRLVRQVGRRIEEGILVDMPLSRQDLAEMTGTTIYTVSRILSDWEQRGLVASGRERVVLRKPHELVVIAEDLPGENPV